MSLLHNSAGSALRLPGSASVRKKSVRFASGGNDENAPSGLKMKPGLVRAKSFAAASSSRPKTPGRKALGNISNSVNTPSGKRLGFPGSAAKKKGLSARKKSAKKASRPALGDISNIALLGSAAGSLGKLKKVKKSKKKTKKKNKKKSKKAEMGARVVKKAAATGPNEVDQAGPAAAALAETAVSATLREDDDDVPEPEYAAGGGSARTADIEYDGGFDITPVAELLKIHGGLGGPTVETAIGAKIWDFAGPEDLVPTEVRKDDVPELV